MATNTRRPLNKPAPHGWYPCVCGWAHRASGMSVIRSITLDGDFSTDSEWRVRDRWYRVVAAYPSLTEAMAFAQSTATLQEEP